MNDGGAIYDVNQRNNAMNMIDLQLQKIRDEKRMGLMTHVVIGYPNHQESRELVLAMADAGSDFIELQIPFSDPVADGPTIMHANQISLEQGTTVAMCFEFMKEMAGRVHIPLLFMTYFNIVFRYGVEKFCSDARHAGCSGLIVPDVPLDEESHEHFIEIADNYDLIPLRVLSPASTESRIKKNAEVTHHKGFVYFVSRKGTTGAQQDLNTKLGEQLQKVRQYFDIPIAVGFGISKPEHITALEGNADIAVVGSEIINQYNNAKKGEGVKNVRDFIQGLVSR